jgi:hypothetical protein
MNTELEIEKIKNLALLEQVRKLRESCLIYDEIIERQHNEIKELKKLTIN